jgi:hypothetical protein
MVDPSNDPPNDPLLREIQELRSTIERMSINVDDLRGQVGRVEVAVGATAPGRAQGQEQTPPQIKVGGRVKILPRGSKNEPLRTARYVGRVFTVTKTRPVYIFFNVGSLEQPNIMSRQRQFVEAVNE